MESLQVNGTLRQEVGKKAARINRSEQAIPCVLYGGKENVHFTTTWADVRHLIYTPDFKLADLNIDGTNYRALLKDVQFHPVSEAIQHIDFLLLVAGVPLKAKVPLRTAGAAPGVKVGGKLIQSVRSVNVKCLPENLVSELHIDITKLELGQTTRVRDITPVEGVEVMMAGAIPVITIEIPRALKAAAAAEAKASGKK